MNPKELLFGRDTQGISLVAVDPVPGNMDTLAVYYRQGDTVKKVHRKNKFYIYTDTENWAKLVGEGKDFPYEICNGPNPLNILYAPESFDHFRFLKSILPSDRQVAVHGAQAYMIDAMTNQFSGMQFEDASRLYFDIEQISTGHFPDPENPEDKVIIISTIYTYKNTEVPYVFSIQNYGDEAEMIKAFVDYIRSMDPDVLVHYNGFRYDLPVLAARCKLFDVKFNIGRDGSEPYSFPTQMKFAEKDVAYTNFNIHGRHCLDVWFMVMAFDVVKREMPGHTLKESAKYFGVAKEDRVYIEGDQITKTWFEDPDKLLQYALDDVEETRDINRILGQSTFYSTQFFPLQHQDVFRYGTGTKIDSLFIRAYIHHKEAFPLADPKQEFEGGYAGCPGRGYYDGPMIYADVKSLYPTLAGILNIQPPKDTLGLYAPMLDLLKEERYRNKDLADKYEAEGDARFESVNSLQNSIKIAINTFSFGWLGWEYGAFNDYASALSITSNGQEVLKKMNQVAESFGCQVLKYDTDGTLIKFDRWEQVDELIEYLNVNVKSYISELFGQDKADLFTITNDGSFDKGIIFDRKSYVLVDRKGKLKIKGNTLKSRSMEPFVREILKRMVLAVLDKDYKLMADWYGQMETIVMGRSLTFHDVAKKVGLKMGKDEYLHKREAGRTPKLAAYELAYNREHEVPYRKGDPLQYYVGEGEYKFTWFKNGNWRLSKVKNSIADLARLREDWNGDYDREHYLDRLHKGVKRLLPVFGEEEFSSYFPSIKITTEDRRKIHADENNSDEDDSDE